MNTPIQPPFSAKGLITTLAATLVGAAIGGVLLLLASATFPKAGAWGLALAASYGAGHGARDYLLHRAPFGQAAALALGLTVPLWPVLWIMLRYTMRHP